MYRKPEDMLAVAAGRNIKERDYWLSQLSGELEKTGFPYDFKKTKKEAEMDLMSFQFEEELFTGLNRLSKGSDYALNVILTAGLILLLNRYSGSSDIMVGSPIYRQDMEGDFINTVLVLRNRLEENKTFRYLLLQVRNTVSEAGKHQNYPLELLFDRLDIPASTAENDFPLFDVIILLENIHDRNYIRHISANMVFSFSRSGNSLGGKLEYNKLLYAASTIERIITHFKHLIRAVIAKPDIKLTDVVVMPEEERKQILLDFNDTAVPYPVEKRIHELFENQVEKTPHRVALVGAKHSAPEQNRNASPQQSICLTYRVLNREAEILARVLIPKGVRICTLVGLMLPRSTAMITGVLGILKAGGAYLPIDPEYPQERISYMLRESRAAVLLTTHSLREEVEKLRSLEVEKVFIEDCRGEAFPFCSSSECFAPTRVRPSGKTVVGARRTVPSEPATCNMKCVTSHSNLAYVIYTSGTTGRPKGVLVEHSSVVNLVVSQQEEFNINQQDRIFQFSSICFDASVEQIFIALCSGAALILVDKETLLRKDRFAGFVVKQSVTHIHAVPAFLLDLELPQDFPLKRLIAGGDICPPHLAQKWQNRCDFYNEYGPTETTVTSIEVKVKEVNRASARLPIGKPLRNTGVYILDKEMNPVPIGAIGELYIGGQGVARGYLNRPELTAEKFVKAQAASFKPQASTSFKPQAQAKDFFLTHQLSTHQLIYRSGDLARWLPDGSIDFSGRIDRQVKIRGFRIETGEIENRLLEHDAVKETVVNAAVQEDGEKYLCGYIVPAAGSTVPAAEKLRDFLSRTLPDYMIPSYFIFLEKIPLSANGKIDTGALPAPQAAGQGVYAAPRDEVEKRMTAIWSRVLGLEADKIGIDDNFFHLGGHSLKAAVITAQIQEELNIKIPLGEVFVTPTIRELAGFARGAEEEVFTSVTPGEDREYYPLSSAQKRFYILRYMEKESTTYNAQSVSLLTGELDRRILEQTIHSLIQRHEILRTSFLAASGNMVQVIHDNVEFAIEYNNPESGKTEAECLTGIIERFVRPFDLSRPPLFRIGLVKIGNLRSILIVDMDHIISDGTSQSILAKEFMHLYSLGGEGEGKLPVLPLQYRDFAGWQDRATRDGRFKQQESWWLKQFPTSGQEEIPRLNLPLDYERSSVMTSAGSRINMTLAAEQTAAIKALALKESATLFMVILALCNVLLAKICLQEDIIVGSPVICRRHLGLTPVTGNFLNTLVLRSYASREKTFREFLKEVGEHTLAAFRNQDYPYDDLVDRVLTRSDSDRNSLFDVFVVLNNTEIDPDYIPAPREETPGLKLSPYPHQVDRSPFDLIFWATEAGQEIEFLVYYRTALFKEETVNRIIENFKEVLTAVLRDRDVKLGDIKISSDLIAAAANPAEEGMGDFGL